jgi:hypothetical protein
MEPSLLSRDPNETQAPIDVAAAIYQNVPLRREVGMWVQDTVRDYIQLATASLADIKGTLSYFSDIVESDLAANVNGYDRIMSEWEQAQGKGIIGAIINHVAQELTLVYGLQVIEQMRLEVFGPRGGCAPHGQKWVSRAIQLYAPEYRIETGVEDFVLWLCVRAARRLVLEQGIGMRQPSVTGGPSIPPKEKE